MKKRTIAFVIACLLWSVNCRAQVDTTLRRVPIPAGKLVLDGLLVLPKQSNHPSPAVIWVGGSGDWEMISNYAHEPDIFYRYYLESNLLARGFAILYMNKRGKGLSTGNWQKADFYDRAADVNAAHRYLASLPSIDSTRIGLIGHSQGGWIVQLAATQNPRVAFTVSLCGSTLDVYTQTIHTYQRLFECAGKTGRQLTRKLRWKQRELALGGFVGRFFRRGEAGQWARIRHYNHDAVLKGLQTPSLMVFSEHDAYVWPEANLAHLRTLFPGGIPAHLQTYVLPGGEHMLHVVANGCVVSWQDLNDGSKYPYSPALKAYLTDWLTNCLALSAKTAP